MKRYSIQDILDLKLCIEYPQTRLEELFKGRKRVAYMTILGFNIPYPDRVLIGIRLLPENKQVEFALWCVGSVVNLKTDAAFYARYADAATYAATAFALTEYVDDAARYVSAATLTQARKLQVQKLSELYKN